MGRTRDGDLSSNGAKKRQLDRVYKRYNGICQICFIFCPRDRASREHVIDLSLGGSADDSNVVLAHKDCNNEKSNGKPVVDIAYSSKKAATTVPEWWPGIIAGQIKGCLIRQARGESPTGVTLRRFEKDPDFRSELWISESTRTECSTASLVYTTNTSSILVTT